jgi:hypothetical protein
MKLSEQAINFFEHLATNAHHQIAIDELLANQSSKIKEIYLANSSEFLKNQFSTTGYLADSIKVTEI